MHTKERTVAVATVEVANGIMRVSVTVEPVTSTVENIVKEEI